MTRAVLPLALLTAAVFLFSQSAMAQSHSASMHQVGAKVFSTSCAMCHGEDGTGTAMGKSLHIPDLQSAAVQSKSNAALEQFISQGKGAMPPFKDTLTPQQILDAVHHVRSFAKHRGAH